MLLRVFIKRYTQESAHNRKLFLLHKFSRLKKGLIFSLRESHLPVVYVSRRTLNVHILCSGGARTERALPEKVIAAFADSKALFAHTMHSSKMRIASSRASFSCSF